MPQMHHSEASVRRAGRAALAQALRASRADTLATFALYEQALAEQALSVRFKPTLNPPLWELGHIGWFQEFWIGRNPQRAFGTRADPDAARPDSLRPGGDALYNSSRVAHARRWLLPLPSADATRADLAAQLEQTLALLEQAPEDDDALYFHRLALFHEDMHHEAALYMARALDIAVTDPRWQPRAAPAAPGEIAFGAARLHIGHAGPGFAFDNECDAHEVELAPFRIDRCALRWRDYLPFVEDKGYAQAHCWSEDGWRWLAANGLRAPLYLHQEGGTWLERQGRGWRALDLDQAACHLSAHEAQAWCRWAGRRLPTEAEWEHAAAGADPSFTWGQVWEWTASPFAPFAGFRAHPYRDYSEPWFDGRPVLKGASHATQPRMRHLRYRNYFTAGRNDIVSGLRSCAC